MGNSPAKSSRRYSTPTGSNIKRIQLGGPGLPGLPAPPGKPVLIPASSEDPQPDIVGIRWERSSSNGGSAIIGYLVEHRRLGSPHWVRSSPNLCPFSELTLSGLEPGWRYQFRVRAQNGIGLSKPSELSDPLTVTLQRSAASTPRFDLELKDTVALENEQIEFVVKFSGTPVPKISWFKDGFEIFSSRRTKIVTENGRSILLIHQTALNDEGEIKCTATNRAGHVSTRSQFVLEAYPRIRLPRQYEDGLLFEQDETIRLKVSVAGKPPPTVTWFHDGEIIKFNDRHIIEALDSGECSMRISVAKRRDRGEYTVKAMNKLGEDITSFLVTVTDRPAAPGKATIAMTLGRSVTLSWKEPDDDGGCKIGTYIVEYYRIGWDVWLKAATCRQPITTLGELIEGSEYKFRVKAENPYGVSDPSDESDVIFIPDPKRGINSPPLRPNKSQSQKEIHQGRSSRRDQSGNSSKRTRSLTREEATGNVATHEFTTPPSRSVSAHRIHVAPPKPPRADSRVTFADTVFLHVEQPLADVAPIPPARPKSKRDKHLHQYQDDDVKKVEKVIEKTSSITTIVRQPYFDDSGGQISVREKSPSPLPKIQVQEPSIDEPTILKTSNSKQESMLPREESVGDEEFRDSSEFMLVLYPDQANGKKNPLMRSASEGDAEDDDEDLVPPPMSLSLPELFSADHQIVEILRDAVSSTELLHERAMERFYKAVAVEEAEAAKKEGVADKKEGLDFLSSKLRSTRLRRRPSTGSPTAAAKAKWNRRRSSESHASPKPSKGVLATLTLPVPQLVASDPNLHQDNHEENYSEVFPTLSSTPLTGIRRWDDKNMPLIPATSLEERRSSKGDYRDVQTPDRELVDELIDDYEESTDASEAEEESDEDLKMLKSRLLAKPIVDEEDTYHPRGQPVYSSTPEPDYRISMENSHQGRPPYPSNNTIQPKSILKKRTEDEPVPLNSFGRPIPPEKPILEQHKSINNFKDDETEAKLEEPSGSSTLSTPSILPILPSRQPVTDVSGDVKQLHEIDDNASLVNAAEAAKNRRRQSQKPELEKKPSAEEQEDMEARMAVVDHYTEILKGYSTAHMTFPPRIDYSRPVTPEIPKIEPKVSSFSVQSKKAEMLKRDEAPHEQKKEELPLKKNNLSAVNSQAITPVRSSRRNESPAPRSRNVSVERKVVSSAPKVREPSQERASSRSSSRTRKRELSRDREVPSRSSSRQRKGPSEGKPSRASSKERFRSFDISPSDSEASQRITRMKDSYQRSERRRSSSKSTNRLDGNGANEASNGINERLIAEANLNVKSVMTYVIDLIILVAASYVYLFKKEILAIPLICLLLYRRIIEDLNGWIPKWWRKSKKE